MGTKRKPSSHTMELPRQIVVGENNIQQVGKFLKDLEDPKKVSIISGKNVKKIFGEQIDSSLKDSKILPIWHLASSNQIKHTNAIQTKVKNVKTDLIIGIGGGRSVDIAKLANSLPSAVICEIMNDDGTMAKRDQLFKYAKKHKLLIAKIEDLISYRLKKESLVFLKEKKIFNYNQTKYHLNIFSNKIDNLQHLAISKGRISKNTIPKVRVISSNVVHNYLINQELPNSFNKTLNYFKKFNNCVLVFIKDTNLKSVTQTLKDYKNKDFYKKGNDKLIRNYGIGAQIIKDLKIKKMILITKSPKKVIGLEGYDIKITKQELI